MWVKILFIYSLPKRKNAHKKKNNANKKIASANK
jgi:hypothetical protein